MTDPGDPLVEARSPGGRHHGFYKLYSNLSDALVRKAIKALQPRRDEHLDKLARPDTHVADFQNLDARVRDALIRKVGPGQIARFEEQIQILEGILKQRKTE